MRAADGVLGVHALQIVEEVVGDVGYNMQTETADHDHREDAPRPIAEIAGRQRSAEPHGDEVHDKKRRTQGQPPRPETLTPGQAGGIGPFSGQRPAQDARHDSLSHVRVAQKGRRRRPRALYTGTPPASIFGMERSFPLPGIRRPALTAGSASLPGMSPSRHPQARPCGTEGAFQHSEAEKESPPSLRETASWPSAPALPQGPLHSHAENHPRASRPWGRPVYPHAGNRCIWLLWLRPRLPSLSTRGKPSFSYLVGMDAMLVRPPAQKTGPFGARAANAHTRRGKAWLPPKASRRPTNSHARMEKASVRPPRGW